MQKDEPSEPVTLYFPLKGGGYGRVRFAWKPDGQVGDYLREPVMSEFHLLAVRNRCKVRDQQARPLRLSSAVQPGTVIVMQRANQV